MRILEELTCHAPQSVAELAKKIGLSYTGTKAQCLALDRAGYLATSKRHRPKGRPELLYSNTPKARTCFPHADSQLAVSLLREASSLFGPHAPDKLLFSYFRGCGETYQLMLKESAPALRARELATLRSSEGHLSRFEPGPPPAIHEGECPMAAIFAEYPQAARYETEALSRALGFPIKRIPPDKEGLETKFLISFPEELNLTGL
jgi:predicted ArsR family transcriptional regulator